MNLLKDNIPKLVRKLALPAMVGMLFQTLLICSAALFGQSCSIPHARRGAK